MNYFEKKQWIRLVCCVLVLAVASLFLSGIIGGEHLVYPKPAEKAAGVTTHEAAVAGFGGGEVKLTIDAAEDGTVEGLVIDASTQTAGLGAKASEEAFTSQFIGKKGPFVYGENGVEAISGATVTSDAVIGAINEALGVAPEVKAEEPKEEPKAEEPKAAAAAEKADGANFVPGT